MKILHLTLKKKWFDMIASGEKKEEYREIKQFWAKRLANGIETYLTAFLPKGYGYKIDWKEFDVIVFSHGYKRDRPQITVEFKGVDIDTGKSKWGAVPKKEYFVIKLGNILTPVNNKLK